MDYLPHGFPRDLLADPLDLAKVDAFCKRYTSDYYEEYRFGHFLMAAYASVPALLTPDLLYRIWMNFSTYRLGSRKESIHRVAVADVLLSGLCKETGYELYEMPDTIRAAFRKWLEDAQPDWEGRHLAKATDIAAFVEQYHAADNPGSRRWGRSYTNRQAIEAVAVRNPAEAQKKYFEWLNQVPGDKKIEQHRLLDFVARQRTLQTTIHDQEVLDDPKSAQYTSPEFQHNGLLADIQKALLQEDQAVLERLVRENTDALREYVFPEKPEGDSVRIELPGSLVRGLYQRPALRALLIGINTYADVQLPALNGCLNDLANMQEMLRVYREKNTTLDYHITALKEEAATMEAVLAQLEQWEQEARHGDAILFHFAGRDVYNAQGRILALHDSRYAGEESTGLYQKELEARFCALALQKRVHIIAIFDTCYNIQPAQYSSMTDNLLRNNTQPLQGTVVLLQAAEVGKTAYERSINGQPSGDFTRTLAEVVSKHALLDYHTLIVKVQEMIGAQQRPFLEAFPASAAYGQFLTGKPGTLVHNIRYDGVQQGWILEAGSKKGIAPGAGFFPTLLRSGNGQDWKVVAVHEEEARIEPVSNTRLVGDEALRLEAVLIQNAPAKTQIALADAGRFYLTDLIQAAVQQGDYHEPVASPATAEVKIAAWLSPPRGFYLTESNPVNTEEPQAPLLPIAARPADLVQQLQAVARFLFVLRLQGNRPSLKNRLIVALEEVEGSYTTEEELDQLPGKDTEAESLTLVYRQQENGEVRAPAFRCRLKPRGSLPVHVYGFYCNRQSFEIAAVGQALVESLNRTRGLGFAPEDEMMYLHPAPNRRTFSLEQRVPPALDARETDYLLLFLTPAPASLEMLPQTLRTQGETWHTDAGDARPFWNVPEWEVLPIPIHLSTVAAQRPELRKKQKQQQQKQQQQETQPYQTAVDAYVRAVQVLVEQNRTEEALDALEDLNTFMQLGMENDLILQKGQLQQTAKTFQQGLMEETAYRRYVARTTHALLELSQSIPQRLRRMQKLNATQGLQPLVPAALAKIAGDDPLPQLNWLRNALHTARAVCRITDGAQRQMGTGFLAADGYVWTAKHVIAALDRSVQVVFGEGHDADGTFVRGGVAYSIEVSTVTESPVEALDFMRFRLTDRREFPLSQWGGLELADEMPTPGEALTIAAFIRDNEKRVDGAPGAVLGAYQQHLFHELPTDLGSSGAPLLNAQSKVVALHQKKATSEGMVSDDRGTRIQSKAGILMYKIREYLEGEAASQKRAY